MAVASKIGFLQVFFSSKTVFLRGNNKIKNSMWQVFSIWRDPLGIQTKPDRSPATRKPPTSCHSILYDQATSFSLATHHPPDLLN